MLTLEKRIWDGKRVATENKIGKKQSVLKKNSEGKKKKRRKLKIDPKP